MFGWLAELYEIRRRNREQSLYCPTCEALKVELAAERREKGILLAKLLSPSEPIESRPEILTPMPVITKHKPWRVIQQELETKDRQEAERILREFRDKTGIKTQPVPAVSIPTSRSENVAAVEKELGIEDAG